MKALAQCLEYKLSFNIAVLIVNNNNNNNNAICTPLEERDWMFMMQV